MNWSAGKIGTIYQKPAQANGLSTPPIGCGLHLPGLPGGGSKIYDRSPYGNIGAITGATWKRLPSGLWYLDFDGQADLVDFGDVLDMGKSDFSVEMWIKADSTEQVDYTTLVGKSNIPSGAINGWNIYFASNAVMARIGDGTTNVKSSSSWANYQNIWTYVVATFDRDGYLTLYLNSVPKDWDSLVALVDFDQQNTTQLFIGRSAARYYTGSVALPRVFNRALTAFEIQNIFNQEKHLFGVW